jgi:ABC-type sugar transport system permease subunit
MNKSGHEYQAFLFVLPLLLLMAVFMVYPALTTFYYGFTKWNGISSPVWRGLANFARLLRDSSFHAAIRNAVILGLYVPVWTILPLLVAASIRKPVSGSGFFRTLSLLPFVISPVILGVLFNVLLRTNGVVNTLLRSAGLGFLATEWLVEPRLVIHVVALVTIFKFFGFGVILCLGAMAKISESLYDSAKIDGCGWLQTLVAVTVPGIRHTIEFFVVLGFITFFARMFPIIFTMTGGGPGYASFVPEFGIYFQAFQNFQLGYSATWAIVVYLMTFVIIFAQVMLMRREGVQ